MENHDNSGKVEKTPADKWNDRLYKLLEQIDTAKIDASFNPYYIFTLREYIQSLRVLLSSKMIQQELEEQENLLNELEQVPIAYWSIKDETFGTRSAGKWKLNIDCIPRYREKLTKMEIALNKVMERVDLTNPTKEKRRVH